jgi:hypothetical protein
MAEQPVNDPAKPVQSPGSLLAEEWYAPDKPKEPAKEDPPVDPPKDEGPPKAAEEPKADDPLKDGEESEEIELKTIEELAEHFQLDPEWLQNLSIKQKVNGKEVSVQLADALSTHRKVAAADTYLSEAKDKAKAIESEAAKQREELQATLATFGKLLESVESEINRDTKGIDWTKLRQDDPAEYAAKKDEIRDRRARLDEMKKEASQSIGAAVQKSQQQHLAQLQERLPQERETLLARIPEWSDDEKAGTERAELVQYLKDEGYGDKDISIAAHNGKLLAMAVKAMRYDKSKQKTEAARKKVIKVPKVLKPGSKSAETKPKGPDWNDTKGLLYG